MGKVVVGMVVFMVGEVVMLESEGGMMAFMVIILTRQDTKSHSGIESTLLQTQLKINIERFHIEHKAYCILEREICILVDNGHAAIKSFIFCGENGGLEFFL